MSGVAPSLDPQTRIRLDRRTRRRGELVVGGSPLLFLRLSTRGAALVERWTAGEPIGSAVAARKLATRLVDTGIAHPFPQPGGTPPDDVDVVIPVRDRAGGLAVTLRTLGPVGGIIVVDDGSTDPSAVVAATTGAETVMLRHGAPQGPAAARNRGWRAATRPLVAFVDADCQPTPGWLEGLLPYFDDPRVGAVAPRVAPRAAPGTPRPLALHDERYSPLDMGRRPGPIRPRSWVPYVPTACLVVRRCCLESLGGFDEALRAGEDVDFVWRLGAAGWALRYEPAAVVAHPVRGTWAAWVMQRYSYGRSAADLVERHANTVAPLEITVWSAAAWVCGALVHPMVGIGIAVARSASLVKQAPGLPLAELLRASALGHARAGSALARVIGREWWPLALALAVAWRSARRPLAAAVLLPALLGWLRWRPRLDPVRWTAVRIADGVAYGAGVWAGCARTRSIGALVPRRPPSPKPSG